VFLITILGLFFILSVILFLPTLVSSGLDFFSENDFDGGRSYIYGEAIEIIKTSPIFGHGPGGHVWSPRQQMYADSHQTLLTIIVQAGIIGLLLFLLFIKKALQVYFRNAYLIAALTPVFMYLIGGDILRKLPTWIILLLFYYYINEKKDSDKTKDINVI
jgi:O-antigen ligase